MAATINTAMVPGTVLLVDDQHRVHAKHLGKKSDIILVPQPSNDPNDPLNWPRWRKSLTMSILFAYGLLTAVISGYTSTAIINIEIANPYITENDYAHAAAIATLFAGWANVLFMPLSNKFGRRSMYLFSLAVLMAGQAIYLTMTSGSGYLAQAALSGIGIAPFEALIELSISDIYFAHERGAKLGLYIVSIAGGSFLGPLIGGYINASLGYQWIIRIGLIFIGALFLLILFGMPETRYIRESSKSELSAPRIEDVDAQGAHTPVGIQDTKSPSGQAHSDDDSLDHVASAHAGTSYAYRSWYHGYALWVVFPGSAKDVLIDIIQPFRVMWYPLVFWTGIVYGSCVCWLDIQAVTVATIFEEPPYLFTTSQVGLLAVASIIGTIFGSIYSGPLSNLWVMRKTRHNNGIREPEFRLWALIPGSFIMGGGLIMYGVGTANGVAWICPAIGMALIAFALTIGGAVMMAYIIDSYKEMASQVITCVIVIRNTLGFAITFGAVDWIEAEGQTDTFVTIGLLAWAIFMSGAIVIVFGKSLRKLTAKSYLRYASTSVAH